jgi:Stage II sporulation protein E (SpoIIE)
MATEPKTILIVRRTGAPVVELASAIRSLGLEPTERDLGAVPSVDFDTVAAILVLPDPIAAAVDETRRLRIDLGERYCPIHWIGSTDGSIAFEAGADALLPEPIAESLANHLVAGRRVRALVETHRHRSKQVDELVELLAKGRAARQADAEMVRSTFRLGDTPPPVRFHSFAIECNRADGPDTTAVDAIAFGSALRIVVVRTPGRSLAATLTALLVRESALSSQDDPGDCLRRINRTLAERQAEYLPAATAILELDGPTGDFRLAQSGLPTATVVRGTGTNEAIASGESQLGIYDSVFPTRRGRLGPGESLRVGDHPTLYFDVRRDHLP